MHGAGLKMGEDPMRFALFCSEDRVWDLSRCCKLMQG